VKIIKKQKTKQKQNKNEPPPTVEKRLNPPWFMSPRTSQHFRRTNKNKTTKQKQQNSKKTNFGF